MLLETLRRLEATKSTWSLAADSADSAPSLVSHSMSRRGRANAQKWHGQGQACFDGDIRRKLARQNKRAEAKARAAQEGDSILLLMVIAAFVIFIPLIPWCCMAAGVPFTPFTALNRAVS